MANENVNVTKGWLLNFYNQKIKPYLNSSAPTINDGSTSTTETLSSSKISSLLDLDKHTYSATEKIVGIDVNSGKNIYEKTFIDCMTISSDNELMQAFTHNISNIDKIISCEGITHPASSGATWCFPRIAMVNNTVCTGLLFATPTNIIFVRNQFQWDGQLITATIQYTKV